ncbi:MAG: diguanylate cyclase, partial [Pyrinomonadaceae bacterium]
DVGGVTISLGVAACPAHARTERELFAASDAALYRAKRAGRNRSLTPDEAVVEGVQEVAASAVCELD